MPVTAGITGPVGIFPDGQQGYNRLPDQVLVTTLLRRISQSQGGQFDASGPPTLADIVDGTCSPELHAAILQFQRSQSGLFVDGHIDPGYAAIGRLVELGDPPIGDPLLELARSDLDGASAMVDGALRVAVDFENAVHAGQARQDLAGFYSDHFRIGFLFDQPLEQAVTTIRENFEATHGEMTLADSLLQLDETERTVSVFTVVGEAVTIAGRYPFFGQLHRQTTLVGAFLEASASSVTQLEPPDDYSAMTGDQCVRNRNSYMTFARNIATGVNTPFGHDSYL